MPEGGFRGASYGKIAIDLHIVDTFVFRSPKKMSACNSLKH
jgi:hypothetical protein